MWMGTAPNIHSELKRMVDVRGKHILCISTWFNSARCSFRIHLVLRADEILQKQMQNFFHDAQIVF